MNIAMMVRSYIPMPRPHDMIYAPIDLAVATAKGLGEKGHHITLFAPIGSEVYGHNVTVEMAGLRPLVHNQEEFIKFLDDTDKLANGQQALWESYMARQMFQRANNGEFDLVFFHHPESALGLVHEYPDVNCVILLHDPIYDWHKELFELYRAPNVQFISISNNQRRDAPDLPYLDTVYNGTDTKLFDVCEEPDDYLMFSGRINPVKGVKEAIAVARESKHKLLIVGPPDHGHKDYFEQYIKPELDEQILYLGRMDQAQLKTYYQKAKALLTPVQWEEPFGLTTIEAMASGTPVISLRRGAAPEIIVDKKTGFICDSISEMVQAVDRIGTINRNDCRKRVEELFSYEVMVDRYEEVLRSVVYKPADASPLAPASVRASSAIKKQLKRVKRLINN